MKRALLILLSFTCFACSSDDDSTKACENLSLNGGEITTNLINTALAFLADDTSETCSKYETAAEAYIEYSNSILDCLEADDKAELQQEIQDLKAEISQLDCA